jgi:hypothetical protein
MPVFDEKQEELEHYETMMGVPRGRLAVTMDTITDAMALVGQHGVYCQSQRWPEVKTPSPASLRGAAEV